MNVYSRAIRHISMNDVKQKHQQKLIEQREEYNQKIEEKKYIEAKLKNEKYDWRKEINSSIVNKIDEEVFDNESKDLRYEEYNWRDKLLSDKKKYFEGMTSAGTFFTTLPATGEVDLTSLDVGNQSSFNPEYTVGIDFGPSGNGSMAIGGFSLGADYAKFSQTPDAYNSRSINTVKVDTTTYTNFSISAIAGNNSNGGVSPLNDLELYWFSDTSFGLLGIIPSSATSLTQYSFEFPQEARGKNVDVFIYEPNVPAQSTQYIGQSIPSLHPAIWNSSIAGYANGILSKSNPTDSDFDTFGGFAWTAMQQQSYGINGAFWNIPGYPAPVSGFTSGTTQADRIAIGRAIYNAFGGGGSSTRYPLTYGIKSIGYQRRTPVNVFVSLDSPAASSFIRSDPFLSNLSPQQRLQKLKEMLEASDEYVETILGLDFPGTGAVPPGEAGDTPGVETIDYGTDLTPLSDNPYGTEVGQTSQGGDYPESPGSQPKYNTPNPSQRDPNDPRNQNRRYDPHMGIEAPNIGPGYSLIPLA